MKICYDGVVRDATEAEIAEMEANNPQSNEVELYMEAKIAAIESAEAAKAAGNQKLLDLGLTQEEASALTGYIPQ
jgi:hypothetical protein